jgi:hypothetical protein
MSTIAEKAKKFFASQKAYKEKNSSTEDGSPTARTISRKNSTSSEPRNDDIDSGPYTTSDELAKSAPYVDGGTHRRRHRNKKSKKTKKAKKHSRRRKLHR